MLFMIIIDNILNQLATLSEFLHPRADFIPGKWVEPESAHTLWTLVVEHIAMVEMAISIWLDSNINKYIIHL